MALSYIIVVLCREFGAGAGEKGIVRRTARRNEITLSTFIHFKAVI